jgi:hypothetical protein
VDWDQIADHNERIESVSCPSSMEGHTDHLAGRRKKKKQMGKKIKDERLVRTKLPGRSGGSILERSPNLPRRVNSAEQRWVSSI